MGESPLEAAAAGWGAGLEAWAETFAGSRRQLTKLGGSLLRAAMDLHAWRMLVRPGKKGRCKLRYARTKWHDGTGYACAHGKGDQQDRADYMIHMLYMLPMPIGVGWWKRTVMLRAHVTGDGWGICQVWLMCVLRITPMHPPYLVRIADVSRLGGPMGRARFFWFARGFEIKVVRAAGVAAHFASFWSSALTNTLTRPTSAPPSSRSLAWLAIARSASLSAVRRHTDRTCRLAPVFSRRPQELLCL